MSITKAIRLSDDEHRKIARFLDKNPFFDFSTLARTAIKSFIEAPTITIRPVTENHDDPKAEISNARDE